MHHLGEVDQTVGYIAKLNEAIDNLNLLSPVKLHVLADLNVADDNCSVSSAIAIYTITTGLVKI